MKRVGVIFALMILAVSCSQKPSPVDLVYTQLDTDHSRWFFFSSACRPFGMVNLSPDTQEKGAWASGYRYDEPNVKGFSHIHAWQMSGMSVMPVTFQMESTDSIFKDCSSNFNHDTERAEVGYHSLFLDRYDILAELTSTRRVGFHRYTFNGEKGYAKGVVFKLNGELGPCLNLDGKLWMEDASVLVGSLLMKGTFRRPKDVQLFFRAEFSEPVRNLLRDTATGNCIAVMAQDISEVKMKVAISYTSGENAALNLRTECPGWDFDAVVADSKEEWNDLLSRIEVEGGTQEQQRRFYTDLWHALQGRRMINDVNGAYPDYTCDTFRVGQIPLGKDGRPLHNHYNSDSFWGAQWSLAPLWGLVYPDIYEDFVWSLMTYYADGGMVARGPSGGNYTYVMTGASSTPFIVSAIQKGIVNDSLDYIYRALAKNHEPGGMMGHGRYEHNSANEGAVEWYIEKGYIPYPVPGLDKRIDGPGMTLEYAFQDYSLALLARKLGYAEEYERFMRRSQNWRNVFDVSSGWMRPKDVNGVWTSPYDFNANSQGFVEATAVQSSWYVPQDFAGLAELMEGKEAAAAKLDSCFKVASELNFTSGTSHEVEMNPEFQRIPVNYGNQPSTASAFVFHGFDRPDLSQYWSRRVVEQAYSGLDHSTGYSGDEDQGMMGSVAVLMKIGLFQYDAGVTEDPVYQIGSTIFDKVTILLHPDYFSGRNFVIQTKNNGPDASVAESISFNGEPLGEQELRHSQIIGGGVLEVNFK